MNQNNYLGAYERTSHAAAFPALMKNVYLWMTLGLAMTGLAAAYVAGNPGWLQFIFTGSTFWILAIAELAIVWYLSARIHSLSFAKAGIMFAVYSLLNGVTLSSIFVVYEMGVISTAFFTTAGTFGAMALLGTFVKRDLSTVGRFCFMALIGLIIATIVNWFMASSALTALINYAGVLIFCGLTAYDTQKIKQILAEHGDEVNEGTMKIALMGSLSLYLDFINLFLFILRILGGGNRD